MPLSFEQLQYNVERSSMFSGGVPVLSRLYSAPREYVRWALEGTRFGVSVLVEAAARTEQLRWQEALSRADQARLARWLRLASPGAAYYDAVTTLADTGSGRFLRYLEAAMAARTALLDFARERDGLDYRFFTRRAALDLPSYAAMEALDRSGDGQRLRQLLGAGFEGEPPIDVSGLPAFTQPEPGLVVRLRESAPGLTLLLAANLILAFVASVSFAGADVRPS
jgi:hypothetical protein